MANGPDVDQVDITVGAFGTAPPVQAGDVITYTLTSVTVTPGGFTNGAAGPNNADAGNVLTIESDTLTP